MTIPLLTLLINSKTSAKYYSLKSKKAAERWWRRWPLMIIQSEADTTCIVYSVECGGTRPRTDIVSSSLLQSNNKSIMVLVLGLSRAFLSLLWLVWYSLYLFWYCPTLWWNSGDSSRSKSRRHKVPPQRENTIKHKEFYTLSFSFSPFCFSPGRLYLVVNWTLLLQEEEK